MARGEVKWKSSRDGTRNQDAWHSMPLAWTCVHYFRLLPCQYRDSYLLSLDAVKLL